MATNVIYIHDLPFLPRRELCRILDADRRWEELGGIYMGYDITTLTLIGQAVLRDKSPTWELLNKFSEKNATIRQLYKMLALMDHQRAMFILKSYVDAKYHCLLRDESTMSTTSFTSCSKKEDQRRALMSQLSMSSMQSTRHQKSSADVSKFGHNFVNLDKEGSSVSLRSKMNSLNAQQTPKKLPNGSNFKRNSNNFEEESTSNNCVSEKMTGPRKSLNQGPLRNERQQKPSSQFACASHQVDDRECLPDILRIPYEEIRVATSNFDSGRVLGKGGFGIVYKGEWKGTSVAIKRLTPRHRTHDTSNQLVSIKQSLNELNILKTCRFDHILPLYAISLDGENPCLIYQLMVNGSLEDRLFLKYKTVPLTWPQRSHIAECITKGLNYLHTTPGKPLVHGDIKSANILLDANMDAKIGDFGLTREGPGCEDTHVKVSSLHGTECYLPLEYLRDRHLSPQVDIYSYGIVLLEIATGLRPIDPKRGKGRKLTEHVELCVNSGRLDSLRDTKAGEENMIWFRELIRIGQICSSQEKRKRPPMEKMLVEFEKINKEISMMEKIRRLSLEKNNPSGLSPIELQIYYDLQKSGTLPKDLPSFPSPSDPLEKNPTLESAACGSVAQDHTSPEAGQNKSNDVPHPKSLEDPPKDPSDVKAPLRPLLSILRMKVSDIDDNSTEFTSRLDSNASSSNDYISDE